MTTESIRKRIMYLNSIKDPYDVYKMFLGEDTAVQAEIRRHLGAFDSIKTGVTKTVAANKRHLMRIK